MTHQCWQLERESTPHHVCVCCDVTFPFQRHVSAEDIAVYEDLLARQTAVFVVRHMYFFEGRRLRQGAKCRLTAHAPHPLFRHVVSGRRRSLGPISSPSSHLCVQRRLMCMPSRCPLGEEGGLGPALVPQAPLVVALGRQSPSCQRESSQEWTTLLQ
jgi:hypothetical protein